MTGISLRAAIALVCFNLIGFASPARAALWGRYDLDTLTEKSALIVEGPIIAIADAKTGQVQVRVEHLYKGDAVKENQTLTIDSRPYTKPRKDLVGGRPLEVGDRLFWFCSEATPSSRPARGMTVWSAPDGGAKFIHDDHVAEFSQIMNPGPPIAEIDGHAVDGNQATVVEFRRLIEQSIGVVAQFQKDLGAAESARDSRKLVELLRQRQMIATSRPRQMGGMDCLTQDVDRALVRLHDYPCLDSAITSFGPHALSDGFATPDGLRYLMARITDQSLPAKKRILYMDALPGPRATDPTGQPIPRPDHFILGFANMAVVHAKDKPTCTACIDAVGAWADAAASLDAPAAADLSDAIARLRNLYQATSDVKLEEQIEWTTWQASPAAYSKLQAPGGPIISVASLPDSKEYAKPKGRDFIASFSLSFCFADGRNHSVRNRPVLEDAKGIAHPVDYEQDTSPDLDFHTFTMSTGSRGGFTNAIHPPDSLPAGTYRLYLRFYENGKLLGRSHSVEVTLPKPH